MFAVGQLTAIPANIRRNFHCAQSVELSEAALLSDGLRWV